MTTTEAPTIDLVDIDERLDRFRDARHRYMKSGDVASLALLDIAVELRAAIGKARYFFGDGLCLERECQHMPDEEDGPLPDMCPAVEVRIALAEEAIRLHRIRERLADLGDLRQQTDVDELRDELGALRSLADGTTDIDDN